MKSITEFLTFVLSILFFPLGVIIAGIYIGASAGYYYTLTTFSE